MTCGWCNKIYVTSNSFFFVELEPFLICYFSHRMTYSYYEKRKEVWLFVNIFFSIDTETHLKCDIIQWKFGLNYVSQVTQAFHVIIICSRKLLFARQTTIKVRYFEIFAIFLRLSIIVMPTYDFWRMIMLFMFRKMYFMRWMHQKT